MRQEMTPATRLVQPHLVHQLTFNRFFCVFRRQIGYLVFHFGFDFASTHLVDIVAVLVRQRLGAGVTQDRDNHW